MHNKEKCRPELLLLVEKKSNKLLAKIALLLYREFSYPDILARKIFYRLLLLAAL